MKRYYPEVPKLATHEWTIGPYFIVQFIILLAMEYACIIDLYPYTQYYEGKLLSHKTALISVLTRVLI